MLVIAVFTRVLLVVLKKKSCIPKDQNTSKVIIVLHFRLTPTMVTPSPRYELSAMDNVLPRYFHGGIWALRLKDGVIQYQVISMLRSSLASASLALPLLTRRAFSIPPTPENTVTGRLEAREHVD